MKTESKLILANSIMLVNAVMAEITGGKDLSSNVVTHGIVQDIEESTETIISNQFHNGV